LKKNEKFDIIIFNPPYLPIEESNTIDKKDWINIATNGGVDGLKFIKKFIMNVKYYWKKNGRAYFIFSSLSDKIKLDNYMKKANLITKIISSQKYDDEKLDVFCISLNH
jgi:release factor glutamine methyltransferase